MQMQLKKGVGQAIERYKMLDRGDSVLVAFSGGPDSVCLLDVLEHLRPEYSLRLSVAHFNHRLRGKDADEDAKFAARMADERGFPFVTSAADVSAFAKQQKLSVEAAGRDLRYEFLQRSAFSLGASKIAVGHTADDQAETVLMRLLRGSGADGLAGIPPVRGLGKSGVPMLIRPLIQVWRADIMKYLKARGLEYRADPSNESIEHLRNKVRLELLPLLQKEYNPRVKERLAAAASALHSENDCLAGEASLVADEVTLERLPQGIVFEASMLTQFHPALRRRVIARMASLVKPDGRMLEASHFADADSLLVESNGRMELPGKLQLEISGGVGLISIVERRPSVSKKTFSVTLDGLTAIPELGIAVKAKLMQRVNSPTRLIRMCSEHRQYFDLGAVRPPLEIRVRKAGDAFNPLGVKGTKTLKEYFIDKKVPRFVRDTVPLLLSNGRIMWVMGHAIDRRFMLKPSSTAALRVDYEDRTTGSIPDQSADL